MKRREYMRIPVKLIPQEFMELYKLKDKIHKEHVYLEIQKGMYGLKQAALLAHQTVSTLLINAGYEPIIGSLGLWKHNTRKIDCIKYLVIFLQVTLSFQTKKKHGKILFCNIKQLYNRDPFEYILDMLKNSLCR